MHWPAIGSVWSRAQKLASWLASWHVVAVRVILYDRVGSSGRVIEAVGCE